MPIFNLTANTQRCCIPNEVENCQIGKGLSLPFLTSPMSRSSSRATGRTTNRPTVMILAVRVKLTGKRWRRDRERHLRGKAASRANSSKKSATRARGRVYGYR
jgi:hypothetical protein